MGLKRKFDEDHLEAWRPPPIEPPASAPMPTPSAADRQRLLRSLQRTAGNRAATALAHRWRTGAGGADRRPLLQRSFEYKQKEYYSAEEVHDKTEVHKDLSGEPGLLAAARALANASDHQVFKTRKDLVEHLNKTYPNVIKEAQNKGAEADEEFEDLLMFLGGEIGNPKGWGHTFSNGRHGDDMFRQPKLAQQRAMKERKEAIGVWVDNEKAKTLIATSFARVGGKDSIYVEDLFGMPDSIGVEVTQDGAIRKCTGFFVKIQGKIVISAYPTNKTKPEGDMAEED